MSIAGINRTALPPQTPIESSSVKQHVVVHTAGEPLITAGLTDATAREIFGTNTPLAREDLHVVPANTAGQLRQQLREARLDRGDKHAADVDDPTFRTFTALGDYLRVRRESSRLEPTMAQEAMAEFERPDVGPRLVITDLSVVDSVRALHDPETLIVTDEYNRAAMESIGETWCTATPAQEEYEALMQHVRAGGYTRVVGVGGCLALDFAKAAGIGKDTVVLPTVLSTNCISNNRSVVNMGEATFSYQSASPLLVVTSIGDLSQQNPAVLNRWSQSGLGDLFSGVSGAIETCHARGELTGEAIEAENPSLFGFLEWVADSFREYDADALERIALNIHRSGYEVLRRGSNSEMVGSEHVFYETLIELFPALRFRGPTHGQLTALGTLLAARGFAAETGDSTVADNLTNAFARMGLPTTLDAIEASGLSREQLQRALDTIRDSGEGCYLQHALRRGLVGDAESVF